jgi:cation diffusion facilitator family transporter
VKEDEAALKEAESTLQEDEEDEVAPKKRCAPFQLKVSTAARLTLSVNFLLLFMKLAASIQSGSLAVISSLLDSVLDLFSGVVISVTNYLIRHYNPFRYPIGRNRLLPVAIIITAAVMGTASLQIVTTAIEDIANGSVDPHINEFSGAIIAVTIILKGVLFLLCFRVDSAAVRALAVDHRNDVASNLAALVFGLLGTYVWKYLDPIGAILLSLYIIVNWILVGREQIRNLVGHRADRRFISKLIYLAKEHSDEIVNVDTVRAYTFGINYLVEVHIVLKPDTLLSAAHDIGESLQLKIEGLKEVERAFVHLDFEALHSPSTEHIPPEPAD